MEYLIRPPQRSQQMSPLRSWSLLSATLLALAACGGGSTEPGTEPDPELEFPEYADSLNLDAGGRHGGSELLFGMDQLNAQHPRLVEIPSSPAGAAATRDLLSLIDRLVAAAGEGGPERAPLASLQLVDCNPVVTGYDGDELIDTDADGIPDDFKVDYGAACVSEPDNAIVRVTISGSRRVQDEGHGFRSFRVTVDALEILVEYLSTGALHRTLLNASEEGRFAAGGATYSTSYTLTEFTAAPGHPDRSWFRHFDLDQTFTPDDGQLLALDAPLPAGTVTFGGLIQHIEPPLIDRIWYNFELDTPTPLQWSPTCNGGDFVLGSFRGHYNGDDGVGFQYSWDGCSAVERELFGYGGGVGG